MPAYLFLLLSKASFHRAKDEMSVKRQAFASYTSTIERQCCPPSLIHLKRLPIIYLPKRSFSVQNSSIIRPHHPPVPRPHPKHRPRLGYPLPPDSILPARASSYLSSCCCSRLPLPFPHPRPLLPHHSSSFRRSFSFLSSILLYS